MDRTGFCGTESKFKKKKKPIFPVRFTLFLNYVYVGAVCACVSVGSCSAKKKTPDFRLQLQMLGRCPIWVLTTGLSSSERAVCTLHH